MHEFEPFGAGEGGGVVDGGHGLAELLGQCQASRDECLGERGERLVEREQRRVHVRHGPRGDLGPVLGCPRLVEREDGGDVGGVGVAGGEGRAEVPALAHGADHRRVAVGVGDDGLLGDPGRDRDRREADAEPVEGEVHLPGRCGRVGRVGGGRRDVVVGAAVFVEDDHEQRVEVVRAGRRRR